MRQSQYEMSSKRGNPVFICPALLPVANPIVLNAKRLQRWPLATKRYLYEQLAKVTRELTLSGIFDKEAFAELLSIFTGLEDLTLDHVEVYNAAELKGCPTGLKTIRIIHCRIAIKVIKDLFEKNPLTSILIRRSLCKRMKMPGMKIETFLNCVPMTVRNFFLEDFEPINLIYKSDPTFLSLGNLSSRQSLCFTQTTSLRTLILQKCSKLDVRQLWLLRSLRHLRITNPVDAETYRELRRLHLVTLDVRLKCKPIEENLILRMLNDDCLLYVMSFLGEKEWFALGDAHSRFHTLLCRHVYSVKRITVTYDKMEDRLERIGPYLKSVSLMPFYRVIPLLPNLESLFVMEIMPCQLPLLTGLKTLELGASIDARIGNVDPPKYNAEEQLHRDIFNKQMFETFTLLTSLTLMGEFKEECLLSLHNIKEFVVHDYFNTPIDTFLRQNEKQLQVLKLQFHSGIPLDRRHVICLVPLKNLKVLHLKYFCLKVALKAEHFPALCEMLVHFRFYHCPDMIVDTLRQISQFRGLTRLDLDWVPKDLDLNFLLSLTNLEILRLFLPIKGNSLLPVVQSCPKIRVIRAEISQVEENSLREYLKQSQRSLTIRWTKSVLILNRQSKTRF